MGNTIRLLGTMGSTVVNPSLQLPIINGGRDNYGVFWFPIGTGQDLNHSDYFLSGKSIYNFSSSKS